MATDTRQCHLRWGVGMRQHRYTSTEGCWEEHEPKIRERRNFFGKWIQNDGYKKNREKTVQIPGSRNEEELFGKCVTHMTYWQ